MLNHTHVLGTYHSAISGNCVDKGTIEYYDCSKSTCTARLDASKNELNSIEGSTDSTIHKSSETSWIKTLATHKELYDCCKAVKTSETSHTWDHDDYKYDSVSGNEIKNCTVCGYVAERSHVHGTATTWTKTATLHKETYDCCGAVKTSEAIHSWNHNDYQYDSVSGKDMRNCTVCNYVDAKEHQHSFVTENTSARVLPTVGNKGSKIMVCVCNAEQAEEISALGWCENPLDVSSYKNANSSSIYIYFGVFPKTIKSADVTVDTTNFVTMGLNKYYKGSDGEWYAKLTANPFDSSYTYSDGNKIVSGNVNYFKVEPIKWKVLTNSYNIDGNKGNATGSLLLAEEILTAKCYFDPTSYSSNTRTVGKDSNIQHSNYKYSEVRAYLNGLDYYYLSSNYSTVMWSYYKEKGFLQTAFTENAQNMINTTLVDNSLESNTDTGNNFSPAFKCDDTSDKIFLLSINEVTRVSLGFSAYRSQGIGNTRIRFPTDYAKAAHAYQNTTADYGGYWWLRSPQYNYNSEAMVSAYDGFTDYQMPTNQSHIGVVPALTVTF